MDDSNSEKKSKKDLIRNSLKKGKDLINKIKPKILTSWSFAKKHALVLTLLLVLVLQFAPNMQGSLPWGGMYMRLETQSLPLADSAATSNINNFLKTEAKRVTAQQYPNLPAANRKKVVDDVLLKLRKDYGDTLDVEQARVAKQIRDQYSYTENGESYVYMPDIDSYYYLRAARNVVETGNVYDILKDGVPWNNRMKAPVGRLADTTWHPYVLAWIHKINSVLNPNTSLMQSATYFPLIVMFFSIILAFLIGTDLSGKVGGFFAATMLSISPAIFGRTTWGKVDTDAYNVLFPLLIVWCLVEAIKAKTVKKRLIFASLTGASVAAYTKFWSGWWYMFDFVLGALGLALLFTIFLSLRAKEKKFWKSPQVTKFIAIFGLFLITSVVLGSLSLGIESFFNSGFQGAIKFTNIKQASNVNLWPNVLTTVAELNPTSLFGGGGSQAIIPSIGGNAIFALAVLGVILLFFRRDEHNKFDITYAVLLALWFAGTIYASLKGVRFILLLGPAFALAFGVGAGRIHETACEWAKKNLHISKAITGVLVVSLVFGIIMVPVKGTPIVKADFNSIKNDIPIMNDAWYDLLIKIRDNSEEDAIINSWWDFGHHFKYVANRAVTFDGASQNAPQAHWIGRALQTEDEDEAIAILRMLDCGATTAYDVAYETIDDTLLTVNFVKELIMMNESSARIFAKENDVSESILEYTHCNPPQNFFIASGDMVGKSGVWSHFGSWNFERAEIWQKWRKETPKIAVPAMMERFNWTEQQAQNLYDKAAGLSSENAGNAWISPWISYSSSPAQCKAKGAILNCGNIKVNTTGQEVIVQIQQGFAKAGKIIRYNRKGIASSQELPDGNGDLVVVMWPVGGKTFALASRKQLANSMFTRLYFMEGLGLKKFKPFDARRQLLGGWVRAFEVDWDGSEPFVPDATKPKTSVVTGARVRANFIGWTDEGVFDSSISGWKEKNLTKDASFDDYESNPLALVKGTTGLIPGFDKAITNMTRGQVKTFSITPEDAYGTDPDAHPLGNKTLNFRVRIETIE